MKKSKNSAAPPNRTFQKSRNIKCQSHFQMSGSRLNTDVGVEVGSGCGCFAVLYIYLEGVFST
ncbi:hypothetical protein AB3X91_36145, partial [Paraburkholderia sp. BR14263]